MKVRIADGSGIDSNKVGRIIPWSHYKARNLREDYPFVGGRTPQGMRWVAIELESGEVTTMPKTRIMEVR